MAARKGEAERVLDHTLDNLHEATGYLEQLLGEFETEDPAYWREHSEVFDILYGVKGYIKRLESRKLERAVEELA